MNRRNPRELAARVEALVDELDALPDPETRAKIQSLLARTFELVHETAADPTIRTAPERIERLGEVVLSDAFFVALDRGSASASS